MTSSQYGLVVRPLWTTSTAIFAANFVERAKKKVQLHPRIFDVDRRKYLAPATKRSLSTETQNSYLTCIDDEKALPSFVFLHRNPNNSAVA